MRKLNSITTLITIFLLMNCVSNKLNTKLPFKVTKTTVINTSIEGTIGKYIQVYVSKNKEIDFINMYYNNKIKPITLKRNNILQGFFENTTNKVPKIQDLNLHGDSTKEFNNTVKKITDKLPFKINKDEVVISFKTREKIQFYKIDISQLQK